jgi:UDP-3-O-acyl N-acetylglucosamine deacetylase
MAQQATIAQPATVTGLGLHTGNITTLRFVPAEVNTGVRFRRVDLDDKPEIPAHISSVVDTQRSTSLGAGQAIVRTVEHILATLMCLRIDNVVVEVDAPETPLTDGSSTQFIEAVQRAGRVEQDGESAELVLEQPVAVEEEGMTLCALPSDTYRVSYTMQYANPILGTQFHSFEINEANFVNEIGPSRTFALYSELEMLLKMGLIKGGSLDNAIVITDQAVLSKEGLRYPDEFVRHKIIDIIGDMSLLGRRLRAHVVSIRSGHANNARLVQAICEATGRN